ncbi:hypothetical protein MGWOODY_Clf2346 [hydrothermal vent metagenome]|uniref:Uncharacterized protein n=1 Tax=hydrothermal vent metagenome TaxID=652676 RepID=A0A160V8P1_9ZZZZ
MGNKKGIWQIGTFYTFGFHLRQSPFGWNSMANMKLDSVVSVLIRRGFEVEAEGDDRQLFIPF